MSGSMAPIAGATGRRRRTKSGDTRIPIWFGPGFGVFGLVFLVLGIGLVRDELRLADDGVAIEATIVRATINRGTGDEADTYVMAYEFHPADGGTVRGSSQVDRGAYERAVPGAPVEVSYLPEDPATNRLGKPEFQPFPSLLVVGAASLFTLAGIGLTWTAVRQRRAARATAAAAAAALARGETHDPETAHAAASLPAPDAFGTYRFTRSPMRIVVELLVAPIIAAAFLAVAAVMLGQVGTDFTFALWGLAFGFFGMFLGAGSLVTVRRGLRSTMVEIGQSGIWLPEMGRLAWDAVREIRVEDTSGAGGSARRARGYARLGVHPRDPALAARAPGGLARGMTGAFFSFIRLARPSARTPDLASLAPFGIAAYELEQPLDAVVALVGRWMPVLGPAGEILAAPGVEPGAAATVPATVAGSGPPAAPAPDPATALAGLLAGSGAPFMATADPTVAAAEAAGDTTAVAPVASAWPGDVAAPREALVRSLFTQSKASLLAAQPVAPAPAEALVASSGGPGGGRAAYRRRSIGGIGALSDLFRSLVFTALPVIVVLVFGVAGVSAGGIEGLMFAIVPLVVAVVFLLVGIPALLEALGRIAVATGDAEALVVDERGITMAGMARLRWDEIAEIRVGGADIVEGGDGGSVDRPRLEIVPVDVERLATRPWAARAYDAFVARRRGLVPWGDRTRRPGAFSLGLDLLDADPDEVIDLIARYRVVDEE